MKGMQGMGKRGDVSFVLVVLVALAFALAALGVMIRALLEEKQQAEQYDALLSELELQQAYAIAAAHSVARTVLAEQGNETLNERFREQASLRELKRAVAGTQGVYAAFQREESVSFVPTEKGWVLEVKGIVLEAREGQSSIKRTLELHLEIAGDGTIGRTRVGTG